MKKLILSVLVAALTGVIAFTGCKKKSDPAAPATTCASCTSAPDAKAANDASSKGIYKGVVVGSSGTIKFDIMNSDSTIKAYMVIDGTSVTLTSSVAWTSGNSFSAPFTGTMNGQPVSITFTIDANGGNPVVTAINIPGHPNATMTLLKETSTSLVKCFEGTYANTTTGKNGTFDLMLSVSMKVWSAQTREEGQTQSGLVGGTFDGTTLSFSGSNGASGSATLSGDKIINGTFTATGEAGTWKADRTL